MTKDTTVLTSIADYIAPLAVSAMACADAASLKENITGRILGFNSVGGLIKFP